MSIRCGHCRATHESIGEVRACSQGGAPAAPAAEPAQEALAPGFYQSGAKVYRLDEEGAWALLAASGHWMTGARAPYRPWRMSVEEVAARGRLVVRCIVCGIRLTKPESRAAGIGPVCRTKV